MKLSKLLPIFSIVLISTLLFSQSVFAVELDHYSEVNTVCTTWTTPTMVVTALNVTDGTDFDFLINEKYLLMVTGDIGGGDINEQVGARLLHGTTEFEGSRMVLEVDESNDNACGNNRELYTWFWWTVWEPTTVGEANEDIIVEYDILNTQDGYHDNVSFLAIHLNNTRITENTDWFFAENTTNTTLTQTFGGSGNATLSFTPTINDKNWLILGTSQLDTGDATVNYATRMFVDGTECTFCDKPLITLEGENPTVELMVHSFARAIPLSNTPQTIQVQTALDGGAGSGTQERLYSSIFALNIDLFNAKTSNYIDPEANVSESEFGTQVISASITPTLTADIVIITDIGTKDNDINTSIEFRVQVDDVDTLPDQTTNSVGFNGENGSTEIWRFSRMSVENLDTSTHNIDVDASQFETGFDPETIHSSLIAFSLSLTETSSPDDPLSMTDDLRLDRPFNVDNPMSMTDFINVRFGHVDPLSMTDDQRYDIVLTPDDPISMTDSIDTTLFTSSIAFDDPISMTDSIATTVAFTETFNDPISMTDSIATSFTLTQTFDDPMSMTDSIATSVDFTQAFDDPISMIDNIATSVGFTEAFDDPMSMTDGIIAIVGQIETFDDPISMTDATAEFIAFSQVFDDPISMTDSIATTVTFTETFNDPISMTDSISITIFTPFFSVDDPMSMTDAINTTIGFSEVFDDPISMTDSINTTIEVLQTFDDPISMTDSIVTIFGVSETFDDPISMLDSIATQLVLFKAFDDPISMKDNINTFSTFGQPVVVPPVTVVGGGGGGAGGQPVPTISDSDGDGILDPDDQCPNEPEVFNGFQDADGCPDTLDQPEPITIFDLGFPFGFNELDVIDDFINLETDSPQPQVEDLGIRWLGDEPVTITAINIGDSPFEFQLQDIPITFGNNQFGYTQAQVIYTVQESDNICGNIVTSDCLDEITYEIPVTVTGEVRGKTVIANGSITIDNSNRFNPYWLVLVFLVLIPIIAFFLWKRRKNAKPTTKTLLKVTQAPKKKIIVTRSKPLKAGTTRKILTESERTNILGERSK